MEIQDIHSPETVAFIKALDDTLAHLRQRLAAQEPRLNNERYLTNTDLGKLLHLSPRTLQNYRDTGVIGYIQISGKILYRESDVLKLLEKNYVKAWYETPFSGGGLF